MSFWDWFIVLYLVPAITILGALYIHDMECDDEFCAKSSKGVRRVAFVPVINIGYLLFVIFIIIVDGVKED